MSKQNAVCRFTALKEQFRLEPGGGSTEFPPCSIIGRVFSHWLSSRSPPLGEAAVSLALNTPSVLPVPPSTMAKCNDPALHEWVLDLKNDKSETSW